MKKFLVALMIAAIMLSCTTAFAAGKLDVTQENFIVVGDTWKEGYAYAKIENVGDKQISVHAGILEIYDEAGDPITSGDYLNAYAKYLQPGEYTYASMYQSISEDQPAPADYMLTITGKSENDYSCKRMPCEGKLELGVKDEWDNEIDYMYATVTNDTEEDMYNIYVVIALLDAEGNILYIYEDGLYSNRALTPGSSMIVRCEVPSNFKQAFESQSLKPASVDAIAYVRVRNAD